MDSIQSFKDDIRSSIADNFNLLEAIPSQVRSLSLQRKRLVLQLGSEDSGYKVEREANKLVVTLQYALDTNYNPADGRILVLDRFELDAMDKNLIGFQRSFENHGLGNFWTRAAKNLNKLQNKAVNSSHLQSFHEQVVRKMDLPSLSLEEQLVYHHEKLQTEPSSAETWWAKALVLVALKRPKEAIIDFLKALAIQANPVMFYDLGKTYLAIGQKDKALRAYENAIEFIAQPRFLLAHGNLAFQMKDYDKAFESYDQLKQMDAELPLSEEADFRRNHGFLMKQMNNPKWAAESFAAALNCYDQLIIEEPENHTLDRKRAEVLDELHKPEEALQAYLKILRFDPDSAHASRRVAELHFELGDYTNAAAAYDVALQNDFENSDLHVDYGIALYHIGLFKDAVVAYDNAIDLDGFNHRALYMRAKAFQALGNWDQFELDWNRAEEIRQQIGE